MWKILWLQARFLTSSADVFALVLHQGECHSGEFTGQDDEGLGSHFTLVAIVRVHILPSRRAAG